MMMTMIMMMMTMMMTMIMMMMTMIMMMMTMIMMYLYSASSMWLLKCALHYSTGHLTILLVKANSNRAVYTAPLANNENVK